MGQVLELDLYVSSNHWPVSSSPTLCISSCRLSDQSNGTVSQLVFEGLDGYAAVSLCGQQIGNTDNQYIQWIFDVTSVLASCQGDIKLELNFGPAQNITHAVGRTATGTSAGESSKQRLVIVADPFRQCQLCR